VGFWTVILASRIADAEIFECSSLLRYNNTEVFGIYDHIYEIAKQRNPTTTIQKWRFLSEFFYRNA
jgi:hypothetical protein